MDPVTIAAAIATTRTLVKSAKGVKDIAQGLDHLFKAQEEEKTAEKGKPKSRTQQIINIRAKEGDEAFDDETSLGSVAADVLEKEQIDRNLKALQREIDNKWGKGTFEKIKLERSKRIAEKHKKKREQREEAQRRAEEEKSFWKKIALETVKAISVIAFVGGGIYLLMYLKDMQ
tara:strand:+ start:1173 stop:1694 length:522 start_codon:yes stop_codon:yes gene_type:complete